MKILRGHVNWRSDFEDVDGVGRPEIVVQITKAPKPDDDGVRFRAIDDRLFLADVDGFWLAFHAIVVPANRYTRDTIEVDCDDGRRYALAHVTTVTASFLNRTNNQADERWRLPKLVDVTYTVDDELYRSRRAYRRGIVTVDTLRNAAHVIDVGSGFQAANCEVVFPPGSQLAFALRGVDYVVPEVFPDGQSVLDVQDAIRAALSVNDTACADEIALRYIRSSRRHHPLFSVTRDPAKAREALLALVNYEAAVKLSDGSFWTKPG